MPPHLCLILLLLAASLAVSGINPASAAAGVGGEDPNAYNSSICHKSFTCGSHDIHYPFYLANQSRQVIDGVAYAYCGYPGMAILCDAASTTATLRLAGGTNYTVLNIDYASHTITLADADALKDTSGCPKPRHNVTIPPEAWLNFTATGNGTISFFLDCDPAAGPPPLLDIIPINCTGFAASLTSLSFLAPNLGAPDGVGDWSWSCAEVYVAPVLSEWLASPEYSPRLGSGGYGDVLRRGFRLSWDPSAGPCYKCELTSGQCGYDQFGVFLGCLCSDGRVHGPVCGVEHLTNARITFIVGRASGILVICLISIACLLGYKAYRSRKRSKETPRIESFLQKSAAVYPKRYSYAQVKKMTGTFAEKLGQGGFGVVYRGGLSGGRQIAVKMLKDSKADVEEFINEVASISTTSHVNVVTLLGFCLEGSKRALIYDYMPNGSLERYAFKRNSNGEKTLSWEKLFDIAVGIARGLEYLHRGCNTRIVHFDIKPHNILLDQDFCPKISDFGMAKLCPNKESVISIGGARGTIGYIAPEVFSKQFGPVSSKSDVYSYGMMVLEMVGARDKHINVNASTERSSQYFPQWIYENLDDYCFSASEINSEITEIVRKMIIIGLWCIQLSASNRPTMTRVVEMLEGSTGCLELPPQVLIS